MARYVPLLLARTATPPTAMVTLNDDAPTADGEGDGVGEAVGEGATADAEPFGEVAVGEAAAVAERDADGDDVAAAPPTSRTVPWKEESVTLTAVSCAVWWLLLNSR